MSASYVVPPPALRALPVAGSASLFPVRRVYCIGRNYAAHAAEMGAKPDSPFFFMKPADAVVPVAATGVTDVPYAVGTQSYHHEVELVAALGRGGRDIAVQDAPGHVFGYAIGLDMTRRDRQQEMKDKSWPWEIGKAADASAPCGPIHPAAQTGHLTAGRIALSIAGKVRQESDLSLMLWPVAEQIAILSRYFTLEPGDLIFSGTPEGVDAVQRGETMVCTIAGLGDICVRMV